MNCVEETPRPDTIAAIVSTTNAEEGPPYKNADDDFDMIETLYGVGYRFKEM